METINNNTVITRSPGKILVCGGYLIISPSYRGLIFDSDTYFKCEGKFLELEDALKDDKKDNALIITIMSKNFQQSYKYELFADYDVTSNELKLEINQVGGVENKFIEHSIINSFFFFFTKQFNNIKNIFPKFTALVKRAYLLLTLNADYRFYTYNENLLTDLYDAKLKTGLGSSAGLICSLNANIIIILTMNLTENNFTKEIKCLKQMNKNDQTCILISAYFSNNEAQRKIGSGFDIQSCMLGSQIFQRKNISEVYIIKRKIDENSDRHSYIINEIISNKFSLFLSDYFDSHLDMIKYVKFPEDFKACLISIESGSDTRILVSKVLEWALANKTKELFDTRIFQDISNINEKIIKIFESNSLDLSETAQEFKSLNIELRKCFKILSNMSGVDIQPEVMSKLFDSLEANGIIFSICPGAGGYDAVFVMSKENEFERIVKKTIDDFNSSNFEFKAHYIPIKITDEGTLIEIGLKN